MVKYKIILVVFQTKTRRHYMEQVIAYLKLHWQYVVIAGGILVFIGAIFRWRWISDPTGANPLGFGRFIYDAFGPFAYRIFMGFLGFLLIVCGVFFLIITP